MENYQGEWKQMKIALSDYKKYPYVNLVFTGVGGSTDDLTTIVPLYVDNINIVDELDGNVALSEFTASESKVSVGDEIQFTATIENKGVSAADDYTVKLYRDGNCVDEAKGDRLNADTWAKVTLKDAPNADAKQTSVYTAEVVWDGDEDNSDNTSKQIIVTVLPGKPYIDAAYAQKAEGGVRLSWSEPKGIADGTKAESVTEDFESYAPFTIEHFGEWTLFDGDKRYTIGIQDGSGDFIKYDNVEAEMAGGSSLLGRPLHAERRLAHLAGGGRSADHHVLGVQPQRKLLRHEGADRGALLYRGLRHRVVQEDWRHNHRARTVEAVHRYPARRHSPLRNTLHVAGPVHTLPRRHHIPQGGTRLLAAGL